MLEVGFANDPRFAVRATAIMWRRKLIDAQNTLSAFRECKCRRASDATQAKDYYIVNFITPDWNRFIPANLYWTIESFERKALP